MSVETDINIFIEHHSSGTSPAQIETFEEYQSSELLDLEVELFPNLNVNSKNHNNLGPA